MRRSSGRSSAPSSASASTSTSSPRPRSRSPVSSSSNSSSSRSGTGHLDRLMATLRLRSSATNSQAPRASPATSMPSTSPTMTPARAQLSPASAAEQERLAHNEAMFRAYVASADAAIAWHVQQRRERGGRAALGCATESSRRSPVPRSPQLSPRSVSPGAAEDEAPWLEEQARIAHNEAMFRRYTASADAHLASMEDDRRDRQRQARAPPPLQPLESYNSFWPRSESPSTIERNAYVASAEANFRWQMEQHPAEYPSIGPIVSRSDSPPPRCMVESPEWPPAGHMIESPDWLALTRDVSPTSTSLSPRSPTGASMQSPDSPRVDSSYTAAFRACVASADACIQWHEHNPARAAQQPLELRAAPLSGASSAEPSTSLSPRSPTVARSIQSPDSPRADSPSTAAYRARFASADACIQWHEHNPARAAQQPMELRAASPTWSDHVLISSSAEPSTSTPHQPMGITSAEWSAPYSSAEDAGGNISPIIVHNESASTALRSADIRDAFEF